MDAWRCPDCGESTTSASQCPTSTRPSGSSSACWGACPSTRSAPNSADDDWMAVQLGVHPRTVIREIRFYRLGNGTQSRGLPVRRRRRAGAAAAQQRHRWPPPRPLRRRHGRGGRLPAGARGRGHGRARRQRGQLRRGSAGSTSARPGACSSSSSASPGARHTRRMPRCCCGIRRGRTSERVMTTSTATSRSRDGAAGSRIAERSAAAIISTATSRPGPASGRRTLAERLRCKPRPGARGAAAARVRGPGHRRREHRSLGHADQPRRVRGGVPDARAHRTSAPALQRSAPGRERRRRLSDLARRISDVGPDTEEFLALDRAFHLACYDRRHDARARRPRRQLWNTHRSRTAGRTRRRSAPRRDRIAHEEHHLSSPRSAARRRGGGAGARRTHPSHPARAREASRGLRERRASRLR